MKKGDVRSWRPPFFFLIAAPCGDGNYKLMILFVFVSGKMTEGLNPFASSNSIRAYDMMITISPFCTFLAAAPLRQITPGPFPFYYVGVKAFAVVVVYDGDFLVGYDVGRIHEVFVYCNAANIVEIGLGDGNSVNF